MQLKLIEKYRLAGLRMLHHCFTHLSGPQAIIFLPLKIHGSRPAIVFDHCPIRRFKELLPTHVQSVSKITDVHNFSALKFSDNLRNEQLINFAAINDWSFAAFLRRLNTIEELLHRPAMHVGAFVMKQNSLLSGVWS